MPNTASETHEFIYEVPPPYEHYVGACKLRILVSEESDCQALLVMPPYFIDNRGKVVPITLTQKHKDMFLHHARFVTSASQLLDSICITTHYRKEPSSVYKMTPASNKAYQDFRKWLQKSYLELNTAQLMQEAQRLVKSESLLRTRAVSLHEQSQHDIALKTAQDKLSWSTRFLNSQGISTQDKTPAQIVEQAHDVVYRRAIDNNPSGGYMDISVEVEWHGLERGYEAVLYYHERD